MSHSLHCWTELKFYLIKLNGIRNLKSKMIYVDENKYFRRNIIKKLLGKVLITKKQEYLASARRRAKEAIQFEVLYWFPAGVWAFLIAFDFQELFALDGE